MDEANHQTDTTDQTNLTEDRPGQPDRSDRARPTRPTTPINHANPTDLIDPADRRTDQANQIGTDSPTDPTNPTSHYQTNQTDRTRRLEHPPTVGMVGASGVCVWWAGRKYRSCVGLHSQLLLQKVPFWKVSSNEDQTKLQVSFPYGLQRPKSNVTTCPGFPLVVMMAGASGSSSGLGWEPSTLDDDPLAGGWSGGGDGEVHGIG